MRLVLCLVIAALLSAPAFAKNASMSIERAHAAANKGDQDAAAALATATNKQTCLNGCADRGYKKDQCAAACRPGLCHTGDQPYCVSK